MSYVETPRATVFGYIYQFLIQQKRGPKSSFSIGKTIFYAFCLFLMIERIENRIRTAAIMMIAKKATLAS